MQRAPLFLNCDYVKLTVKQTKALDFLEDNLTTEVLFGGAAGGGKSDLGCYFQLKRRLKYPGTRGLIGRSVLKTLKETTLQTLFERAKKQGLRRGVHFDLTSSQDKELPGCLTFINGSIIYLRDLYPYPSDPDFDELGSLELTDAFIDESSQVTDKAKNIVRSRIRYRLEEFGLIPKLLLCGNPSKNWQYSEFYRPFKEGTIRSDRRFVQALAGDNPHLPPSYIESLKGLDKVSRARLLYGEWEYDDDPARLIEYDKILDLFKNDFVSFGSHFITCDVARFGNDRTVIGLWNGFRVRLFVYKGLSIPEVVAKIKAFQAMYKIPASSVVCDEDGVGGGAVDLGSYCGFVNGSKPFRNPVTHEVENYQNLKSQCYFRLAERINKAEIFIECDHPDIRAQVIEELEQVKQNNVDRDGKKSIVPKEKVKELIGRSPDFSDTLMMREFFGLRTLWKVAVA